MNVRHPFDQTPEPVVLGLEFNEDGTAFSVGTTEGFRVYDSAGGKLIYDRGEYYSCYCILALRLKM
jgi:hypothetical protein